MRQHGAGAGMAPPALDRFIQHFERVSRHMLDAPPPPGAIVIDLDAERRVDRLVTRAAAAAR